MADEAPTTAWLDQWLQDGRVALADLDRHYFEYDCSHLSTEDMFGAVIAWIMHTGLSFEDLAVLTAAAVVDRVRPPLTIPEWD